jgi:hypothetical protein
MDFAECKIEIENIKSTLLRLDRESTEKSREIWSEINILKANHGSHDTIIQKLALSIDHMGKEFTKSINSLTTALDAHLKEEKKGMEETIKELRSIGWKVFSAIVLTGLAGQFGMKLIG